MWEGICHMARYYACSICFRELLHCNLLAASDVEAFFPLGIGYATAAEVIETFFSYSSPAKQMQYSRLYIIIFSIAVILFLYNSLNLTVRMALRGRNCEVWV